MPTNGEKYITGIPDGGTASFTVYFQSPLFDLLIINLPASLSKAVYFDKAKTILIIINFITSVRKAEHTLRLRLRDDRKS